MIDLLNVLLMQPSEEGGGGYQSIIFLLLIGLVIFIFFIKPKMQKKNTKDNGGKYSALKIVAEIINVLGIIFIIIGVIGLVYFLSENQIAWGIGSLLAGIIVGLPFIAMCNLIYVLIDIEFNTRKLHTICNHFQEDEENVTTEHESDNSEDENNLTSEEENLES